MMKEGERDPKLRPLDAWEYFGLAVLYAVPVIGWVFLIIFSFSDKNIHRRSFSRSYWCGALVFLFIFLVFLGVLYGLVGGTLGGVLDLLKLKAADLAQSLASA